MGRKATEKNPVRVKNIEKLMEREGLSKSAFSKLVIGENNLPNFLAKMKTQKITEDFIDKIRSVFPLYRKEWLMGLDEDMTEADHNKRITFDFFATHNDRVTINASVFRQLAILNGFEVVLYDSGVYVDENGMYLDRYLVRNGEETRLMNYQEIADFIEYLSALTVHRINKLFKE